MSEIKMSDMLFSISASNRKPLKICPSVTLGVTLPNGYPTSALRTSKTSGPKVSRIGAVLDKFLADSAVSAIISDDGIVYMEMADPPGSNIVIYYGGGNIINCNRPTADSATVLTALLLHKLADRTASTELSLAVEDVVNEYTSKGTVDDKKIGLVCDSFYYETKDSLTTLSLELLDGSTLFTELEQAMRTGYLHPVQGPLRPATRTVFANINCTSPETETKIEDSDLAGWYDRAKRGEFDVGFMYKPEQEHRVRPLSFLDRFIPNEAFRAMTTLANYDLTEVQNRLSIGRTGVDAIGDNYLNMILVGKPGTGKTTTAEALSAALGLPIYTVANTKNTEEDTFQGMTKVVEGGFQFKETPFLEAYENGGIIVLEEFNLADPGVMQGAIGQAIEYPFVLMKDGYQEVHRNPMCIFISTMNTATQGSREPNEALTSRSPITIMMEDPDKQEFINILASKGFDNADCKRVYAAYQAIINYLKNEAGSEEYVMCVTLRHCLGCLKLMKAGFDFKRAVKDTMIGSMFISFLVTQWVIRPPQCFPR